MDIQWINGVSLTFIIIFKDLVGSQLLMIRCRRGSFRIMNSMGMAGCFTKMEIIMKGSLKIIRKVEKEY